jgi:hypothetical protein
VWVPTSTITNDSGEQESEDDEARDKFKLLWRRVSWIHGSHGAQLKHCQGDKVMYQGG